MVLLLLRWRQHVSTHTTTLQAIASKDFKPVFYKKHMRHEMVSKDKYLELGFHMPNPAFDTLVFISYGSLCASYKPNYWCVGGLTTDTRNCRVVDKLMG